MKAYDLVVIYKPGIEDQALEDEISKVSEVLKAGSSEIGEVNRWGKKPLGYQIAGERTGSYVMFRFRSAPSLLPELRKELVLNENVLRHRLLTSSSFSGAGVEEPEEVEEEGSDEEYEV